MKSASHYAPGFDSVMQDVQAFAKKTGPMLFMRRICFYLDYPELLCLGEGRTHAEEGNASAAASLFLPSIHKLRSSYKTGTTSQLLLQMCPRP